MTMTGARVYRTLSTPTVFRRPAAQARAQSGKTTEGSVMIVWPNMMGPGWEQQLLLAVIMQCGIIAILVLVLRAACRISGPRQQDTVLALWRLYEQGDLTAQEFSRLRRATRAAVPAPAVPRPPVVHRATAEG
jgi:hypothetical protein